MSSFNLKKKKMTSSATEFKSVLVHESLLVDLDDNLSAVLMKKGELKLVQQPVPSPDKTQVLIKMQKVKYYRRKLAKTFGALEKLTKFLIRGHS